MFPDGFTRESSDGQLRHATDWLVLCDVLVDSGETEAGWVVFNTFFFVRC